LFNPDANTVVFGADAPTFVGTNTSTDAMTATAAFETILDRYIVSCPSGVTYGTRYCIASAG
jgi:hypothetical protein